MWVSACARLCFRACIGACQLGLGVPPLARVKITILSGEGLVSNFQLCCRRNGQLRATTSVLYTVEELWSVVWDQRPLIVWRLFIFFWFLAIVSRSIDCFGWSNDLIIKAHYLLDGVLDSFGKPLKVADQHKKIVWRTNTSKLQEQHKFYIEPIMHTVRLELHCVHFFTISSIFI